MADIVFRGQSHGLAKFWGESIALSQFAVKLQVNGGQSSAGPWYASLIIASHLIYNTLVLVVTQSCGTQTFAHFPHLEQLLAER